MAINNKGKNNPNWKGGLVELTCEYCGEKYKVKQHRKDTSRFCSAECLNKWQKEHPEVHSGENSPRWNQKKVICGYCGKEFYKAESDITDHNFCSKDCQYKWMEENVKGKNHPSWSGGKVSKICEYCGKKYEVKQYREDTSRFCSAECLNKWQKEHPEVHSEENSPSWKGGKSFLPYPPEFNENLKEKVRKRDNRTCQYCGTTDNTINGEEVKMTVHHIDGDKTNSSLNNLVTLCHSCNSKIEHMGVRPQFAVEEATS